MKPQGKKAKQEKKKKKELFQMGQIHQSIPAKSSEKKLQQLLIRGQDELRLVLGTADYAHINKCI